MPWRTHRTRIVRFAGAGALSAVTDFAVFAAAGAAGAAPAAANVVSFLAANAQSYVLNARLTFRTGGRPTPLSPSGYGRFFFAHLFSLALSTALVAALAPAFGAWPAKIAAALVAGVWNYAASSRFVFVRPREGA